MTTFNVTFRNRLNPNGETCEFPTDSLDTNGATIMSFEYVESEIRQSEKFARETWQYEVEEEDRFRDGLANTPTVIEYTEGYVK